MKVLAVIPGSEEGYSMIFCKRQVSSLIENGITVQSFYLKSRTSLRTLFSERKRLKKTIRIFKPDILHCYYGTVTALLGASVFFPHMVISFLGSDVNRNRHDPFLRNFLGRSFSNIALLQARKAICVSSALKTKLWWGRKKASVITFGVNTEFFKPIDKSNARQMLGWNNNESVILFSSSDNKVKRLDIAERVVQKVCETKPDTRLEVISGQYEESQLPYVINASDCLLVCSDSEGSPTIVKEAMSCNLPVISNDVGDVKERLQGTSSHSIVPQNSDKLAESIVNIIVQNERSNGREKIIADGISEKQVTEKIIHVYKTCY
ncbi:MAG: glycosyltransferase [Bacteroidota bacterium]